MNSNALREYDVSQSSNQQISLDLCYKIDELKEKFTELYKNLHHQKLHKNKTHYKNKDTIELFSQYCDKLPHNLDSNWLSTYLTWISKREYDTFSAYTIAKILWINIEVFRKYRDIKSISNTIWAETFKRNGITNTTENLKTAFEKYESNPDASIDNLIQDTKNEVVEKILKTRTQARTHAAIQQKQAEQKQKETEKIKKTPEKIAEIQEKIQLSKDQKRINLLNLKIASRIENIKYQLWDKYENFIIQFEALIKISLQWWDIDSKWNKIDDNRYTTLSLALTNAQAATAYIKQFLHENKQEWENNNSQKLRYFSYDKWDWEKKYLTNDDITDQIGELFLFKVELTKLLDKNT